METGCDTHTCHCHEGEGYCCENEDGHDCCHEEDGSYPQLPCLEFEPDDFNDWD